MNKPRHKMATDCIIKLDFVSLGSYFVYFYLLFRSGFATFLWFVLIVIDFYLFCHKKKIFYWFVCSFFEFVLHLLTEFANFQLFWPKGKQIYTYY